jgi:hypothetical protein
MSKLFTSKFDKNITINIDYNGYYLSLGNNIDLARKLIKNIYIRRCIQIESHLLTFPDKTIYAVLTDNSFELFYGTHGRALHNYHKLDNEFKGVYRVKGVTSEGVLQLVGVNISGNIFENHIYNFINDNCKNLIEFKVS